MSAFTRYSIEDQPVPPVLPSVPLQPTMNKVCSLPLQRARKKTDSSRQQQVTMSKLLNKVTSSGSQDTNGKQTIPAAQLTSAVPSNGTANNKFILPSGHKIYKVKSASDILSFNNSSQLPPSPISEISSSKLTATPKITILKRNVHGNYVPLTSSSSNSLKLNRMLSTSENNGNASQLIYATKNLQIPPRSDGYSINSGAVQSKAVSVHNKSLPHPTNTSSNTNYHGYSQNWTKIILSKKGPEYENSSSVQNSSSDVDMINGESPLKTGDINKTNLLSNRVVSPLNVNNTSTLNNVSFNKALQNSSSESCMTNNAKDSGLSNHSNSSSDMNWTNSGHPIHSNSNKHSYCKSSIALKAPTYNSRVASNQTSRNFKHASESRGQNHLSTSIPYPSSNIKTMNNLLNSSKIVTSTPGQNKSSSSVGRRWSSRSSSFEEEEASEHEQLQSPWSRWVVQPKSYRGPRRDQLPPAVRRAPRRVGSLWRGNTATSTDCETSGMGSSLDEVVESSTESECKSSSIATPHDRASSVEQSKAAQQHTVTGLLNHALINNNSSNKAELVPSSDRKDAHQHTNSENRSSSDHERSMFLLPRSRSSVNKTKCSASDFDHSFHGGPSLPSPWRLKSRFGVPASVSAPLLQQDPLPNQCSDDVESAPSLLMSAFPQFPALLAKRRGGWPKGRKRKPELKPAIKSPKAPHTAYVMYITERRRQFKQMNMRFSFGEATKLAAKEWQTMSYEQRAVYLNRNERDKGRYRNEIQAFRQRHQFQLALRKKRLKAEGGGHPEDSSDCTDGPEDDVPEELYCEKCDKFFSSLHNKRLHLHGRPHNRAQPVRKPRNAMQAILDHNFYYNTDNNTGYNTDNNTDYNTDNNTDYNTDCNTDYNTDCNTDYNTDYNTDNNTDYNTDYDDSSTTTSLHQYFQPRSLAVGSSPSSPLPSPHSALSPNTSVPATSASEDEDLLPATRRHHRYTERGVAAVAIAEEGNDGDQEDGGEDDDLPPTSPPLNSSLQTLRTKLAERELEIRRLRVAVHQSQQERAALQRSLQDERQRQTRSSTARHQAKDTYADTCKQTVQLWQAASAALDGAVPMEAFLQPGLFSAAPQPGVRQQLDCASGGEVSLNKAKANCSVERPPGDEKSGWPVEGRVDTVREEVELLSSSGEGRKRDRNGTGVSQRLQSSRSRGDAWKMLDSCSDDQRIAKKGIRDAPIEYSTSSGWVVTYNNSNGETEVISRDQTSNKIGENLVNGVLDGESISGSHLNKLDDLAEDVRGAVVPGQTLSDDWYFLRESDEQLAITATTHYDTDAVMSTSDTPVSVANTNTQVNGTVSGHRTSCTTTTLSVIPHVTTISSITSTRCAAKNLDLPDPAPENSAKRERSLDHPTLFTATTGGYLLDHDYTTNLSNAQGVLLGRTLSIEHKLAMSNANTSTDSNTPLVSSKSLNNSEPSENCRALPTETNLSMLNMDQSIDKKLHSSSIESNDCNLADSTANPLIGRPSTVQLLSPIESSSSTTGDHISNLDTNIGRRKFLNELLNEDVVITQKIEFPWETVSEATNEILEVAKESEKCLGTNYHCASGGVDTGLARLPGFGNMLGNTERNISENELTGNNIKKLMDTSEWTTPNKKVDSNIDSDSSTDLLTFHKASSGSLVDSVYSTDTEDNFSDTLSTNATLNQLTLGESFESHLHDQLSGPDVLDINPDVFISDHFQFGGDHDLLDLNELLGKCLQDGILSETTLSEPGSNGNTESDRSVGLLLDAAEAGRTPARLPSSINTVTPSCPAVAVTTTDYTSHSTAPSSGLCEREAVPTSDTMMGGLL